MGKPLFVIKNHFQKRSVLYQEILTEEILSDVCNRITGRSDYRVIFDNTNYNIGRLAILEYNGVKNYISFSEKNIGSRNSFFQSFTSALLSYYEGKTRKNIFYYFLEPDGNIETAYFLFMYRLMATAGTIFLNSNEYLKEEIKPFNTVSDIIAQREINRGRNRANASSYATVNEDGIVQVYGKTYGANKYETTLLCLALNKIKRRSIQLFEIAEGNLSILPARAGSVVRSIGINVVKSDLVLEKNEYEENDSLRSPTFIYNLLEKYGEKRCVLCECEIPQIIQGAHIWPVAKIKKAENLTIAQRINCAIDGDNGIWLCNNHHKLFDMNLLFVMPTGRLKHISNINHRDLNFIRDITTIAQLSVEMLTPRFVQYLNKRNAQLNEKHFTYLG